MEKVAESAFKEGKQKSKSELDELIVGQVKSLGEIIRVCCFARSPRNLMLWAHYARNHRGVVLMFRSSELVDKE
jgi:hypothetical protein